MKAPPSSGQPGQLGQPAHRHLVREHRPARHLAGEHAQGGERSAQVAQRTFPERCRIHLQLHQPAHALQRVTKHVSRALQGAEQVAAHREAAALHPGEVQRRSPGPEHSTVNLRRLQVGVHLGVDAHQVSGAREIVEALGERGVGHAEASFLPRRRAPDKSRNPNETAFLVGVQLLRPRAISRRSAQPRIYFAVRRPKSRGFYTQTQHERLEQAPPPSLPAPPAARCSAPPPAWPPPAS
jgi:hypothetical protein